MRPGTRPDNHFRVGEQVLCRRGHRDWVPAEVVGHANAPCSHYVRLETGVTVRRHQSFLKQKTSNLAIPLLPEEGRSEGRPAIGCPPHTSNTQLSRNMPQGSTPRQPTTEQPTHSQENNTPESMHRPESNRVESLPGQSPQTTQDSADNSRTTTVHAPLATLPTTNPISRSGRQIKKPVRYQE